MSKKRLHIILFLAIWLSGFSGLTNQVVWQRALKLALGGAESLSSMVVVLVFMGGLGAGSLLAGHITLKRDDHLTSLAKVECGLGLINCVVWLLLIAQVDSYFMAAQGFAVSLGLPLKLVQALISIVLLAVPCCLMGMTTPFAAAALQQCSEDDDNRILPLLFFFNTLGGLIGAVVTGWFFMPYVGQKFGLVIAILCNLAAGGLVFAVRAQAQGTQSRTPGEGKEGMSGPLSRAEKAALLTGAIALGYEMLLFRGMSLAYEPVPYIFSSVLCLFLLTWSIGVWASSHVRLSIRDSLLITAGMLACVPSYLVVDRFFLGTTALPWMLFYFAPVILFGVLYGHLVQEAADDWGRDVSRFYALNTLGSCLGILGMTLIAFYFSVDYDCYGLALCLILTSLLYAEPKELATGVVLIGVVLYASIFMRKEAIPDAMPVTFYGPDGVVEVAADNVVLDGLWHSKLANGLYIGTNNWYMAVAPLLAHPEPEKVKDVLIVGFGTGITAHVFKGAPNIEKIEAYEINRTLKQLFKAYSKETMNILAEPRLNLLWQDGRSGLELRNQEYDIITSAPLYLKQAGSASLLSKEYFQKAAGRLKKNGVIAVYSNGTPEQALLVRKTLAQVFPHTMSVQNGYLLLGSMSPITIDQSRIDQMTERDWAIAKELEFYNSNSAGFAQMIDEGLSWDEPSSYLITDDHPLVEYPDVVGRLLTLPASPSK